MSSRRLSIDRPASEAACGRSSGTCSTISPVSALSM
jgi:hypothetical protein